MSSTVVSTSGGFTFKILMDILLEKQCKLYVEKDFATKLMVAHDLLCII